MISQQELAGSWTQFVGKIKEKWGQVTDHELSQVQGNVEQVFLFRCEIMCGSSFIQVTCIV